MSQSAPLAGVKVVTGECDIVLILRSAISSNLANFLSNTLNDSLVLTILRQMINELDYSPFNSIDECRKHEAKLTEILNNVIPFDDTLSDIKKILVLIKFHEEHDKFFDLYVKINDLGKVQCRHCHFHPIATYLLDDIYSGCIPLRKQWYCDDGQVQVRYSVDMSYFTLREVLKGNESYDLAGNLLLRCGDIESNPGPEVTLKDLEQKIREMQERLKKLDNKSWRDNDRRKTKNKNKRRNAQGMLSFCKNTGEAMNVMANGMGPVLDSIKNAMDSIAKTGDDMKAAFKIPCDVDIVGSLISLTQLIDSILKKSLFTCSLACAQLARQCGVTISSFMTMIPTLRDGKVEFAETEDKATGHRKCESLIAESLFGDSQGLEDKYPIVAIGTVIAGVITLFCKGVCPPIKEMLSHFGVIGRAAQGFRAVRDFFVWIWDYAMSIYCNYFYGMSHEEYKISKEFPELGKISGGIKVTETIPKELISNSAEICEQIISMKAKLDDYIVDAAKTRSKNLTFITKLRDKLKEKYELAYASPALANSIRDEPVCVYLYGQPGVGKSVMTKVLTADYYRDYLKGRGVNYNSTSHSRKAVNEHWDGYSNQPILIVDDFANKKDNVVNPCAELEELQYMVNTSEYPLWMADLAKKGTTYFTSELILLSANLKYPEIVHMADPSSIYRRVHIWAEVICKSEYGTPTGVDKDGNHYYQYNKAQTANYLGKTIDKVEPLMTDQYLIKIYHISMNKQTGAVEYLDLGKVLTYDEFYKYFKTIKEERSKINRELSDAIRKRVGLPEMGDKVSEKMILDQFRDIFDPTSLIDCCAEVRKNCPDFSKCQCEQSCEDMETCVTKNKCACKKLVCICGNDDEEECECLLLTHGPSLSDVEMKEFKRQFGDILTNDFNDASDEEIDQELIDVSTPDPLVGAWKIKLRNVFDKACKVFCSTIKYIYSTVASGLSKTCSKMVGVAGAFLGYVGAALARPLPAFTGSKTLDATLMIAVSGLIGYLGRQFFLNIPSACEFSLHLNEIYSPCKRCDVCNVMQYSDEGGYFDHFLRRIGVPQVKAALMRCQVWTDAYLSKILQKAEERVRVAERVYSSQPAVPRPNHYAQALFTKCAVPATIDHISKTGFDYIEAMRLIGSLCRYNCDFCSTQRQLTYNPLDNDDAIRLGKEIYDAYVRTMPMPLPVALIQGSKRHAEGDLVRLEQCTNVLTKNSVWIQAVTADGVSSKSTGTFVVGRTLLVTAHSIRNANLQFKTLQIQNPNSKLTVDIPLKDCKISQVKQADGKPTDLALITLPQIVPSRPKIVNKFMSAKDIDVLKEGDIVLSGYRIVNEQLVINEQQTKKFNIGTKTTTYYEHPLETCPFGIPCKCSISIGKHIDYEIDTYPGCCGSLISAKNKNIPAKIIGFHVAGGAGEPALGVIMTSELLQCALQDHINEHSLPSRYMIDGRFPYSDS